MMPLNIALAAVLLTGHDPPGDLDHLSTARPALRSLASAREILDPREERYLLTRAEDFPSDLKLLRKRWADLKDAPPLYDCMRFPDRALVNDILAFNRAYQQRLEDRIAMEPANEWRLHRAILECQRLYRVWDLVRDCRCDYYYVTVRRQALKDLKEAIGDRAYYSGQVPCWVPLGTFQRIDY